MAAKKPVRKTTKVEVDAEVENIAAEVENKAFVTSAQENADRARINAIAARVADVTVEKVVNDATRLSLNIQSSLNGVAAELKTKLEELHELTELIEAKKRELEELGKKDAISTSIDLMILEHTMKSAELREKLIAQRKSLEEEAEQEQQRRERETAEYEYRVSLDRREALEAERQNMQNRERANKLKQEDLERAWALKTQELDKRESELAQLKARLDNLDKEVEMKVAAAVKAATESLNASKHFEVSHLKKDAEAAKALADQTIASLQLAIATKDALIENLQSKLDVATAKVQSIAEKALESQSGRASMEAVQTFAATQQPQAVYKK